MRQGDAITPYYDPMIAKLIVHGADRAEAIARLRAALGEYHVAGVQTNIEFLHRLTSAASFVEPRLDTALIERERDWLFAPRGAPSRLDWNLAVLALSCRSAGRRHGPRPGMTRSGWRLGAAGQRHQQGEVRRPGRRCKADIPGVHAAGRHRRRRRHRVRHTGRGRPARSQRGREPGPGPRALRGTSLHLFLIRRTTSSNGSIPIYRRLWPAIGTADWLRPCRAA